MPQLGKGRSVVLVDPDAHKVATHPSASPESLRCARPRATPQTSGPGTYRFVVIGSTGSHSIYSITGSASAPGPARGRSNRCLLYTSDAADDLLCVDLGGRRII